MNIEYFLEKCKEYGRGDVAVALIVVLVGLGSFGLGRLSMLEEGHPPLRILYPEDGAAPAPVTLKGDDSPLAAPQIAAVSAADENGTTVVASKNGTKYYLPSCSGASRIAPANLVSFPSPRAAKNSGYEPAANCPGI